MIAVIAVDDKQFKCFVDSYVDHIASWACPKSFDPFIVRCQFVHIRTVLTMDYRGRYEALICLDGWDKIKDAFVLETMVRRRVKKPSSK